MGRKKRRKEKREAREEGGEGERGACSLRSLGKGQQANLTCAEKGFLELNFMSIPA